jgi:hypothetical protein
VTDGCVSGDKGLFRVAPPLELKKLEAIFRHKVFRMLPNKGKITKEVIAMLSSWRYCRLATSSAAAAYRPTMIRPWNIFRSPASGHHLPKKECSTWIRRGRSCRDPKTARQPRTSRRSQWLGAMWSHIPNRG